MIYINYYIKDISAVKPAGANSFGKVRGLACHVLPNQPHAFILEACGKYYTIQYIGDPNNPNAEAGDYDELSEFVEVIKPLLVWGLIV